MKNPEKSETENLRERNEYLRRRLESEKKQVHNLREETARLDTAVEEERKEFFRLHSALNVLRDDANRVMRENGAVELQKEMERWREDYHKLRAKRRVWGDLARKAVVAKAETTRELTDAAVLTQQLREAATRAEQQREDAVVNAQKVIESQRAQLDRIEEQCRLWKRGELDTMTTIAGITGEVHGYHLPEPGAWERAKAVKEAELRADLLEASDDINEWKTREARARGASMQLLDLFGHGGGGPLSARLQAGQYDEVIALLKKEQGKST